MRRSGLLIALVFTAALSVSQGANAQSQTSQAIEADPKFFTRAYSIGMGFPNTFFLDRCGEPGLGQLARRAMRELVDSGPDADSVKEEFRARVDEAEARVKSQIQEYVAQHGPMPDYVEDLKTTCTDLKKTPAFLKFRDRLERYGRGEISAEAIDSSPENK